MRTFLLAAMFAVLPQYAVAAPPDPSKTGPVLTGFNDFVAKIHALTTAGIQTPILRWALIWFFIFWHSRC
ncbi:hypothetical protein [Pseudoduganella sp. UC29_106]|uniref:hypothetical protein n=1 Tax=Pseudoduganella sp. UC29_106 TaxID=3374553 RepID=UPI0037573AF9